MNVWPTLIGKVVVTLWMWQCDNVLIMIQSLYVKTCVTMSSPHCANFVSDVLGLLGKLSFGDSILWNVSRMLKYEI